ncbi:hypothetical protein VNI00_016231 [Paramarasmius palmivorus]|uniref:Uncharacterized protein n=1 Tax=Paramarasmius palmivorus TaxID=297713 RepID=A0AAW0BD13_9AGAR
MSNSLGTAWNCAVSVNGDFREEAQNGLNRYYRDCQSNGRQVKQQIIQGDRSSKGPPSGVPSGVLAGIILGSILGAIIVSSICIFAVCKIRGRVTETDQNMVISQFPIQDSSHNVPASKKRRFLDLPSRVDLEDMPTEVQVRHSVDDGPIPSTYETLPPPYGKWKVEELA